MAKIIETRDGGGFTHFILDNGEIIEAEYGFSVGKETGCHNFYDTRTICRLFANADSLHDGDASDSCGFECSSDYDDCDYYDWDLWESEIVEKFRSIGWVD